MMSTKNPIANGELFQLYSELFDGNVYLEVETEDAEIIINEHRSVIKLRLPKELLKRLKLDDIQLEETPGAFDEGWEYTLK